MLTREELPNEIKEQIKCPTKECPEFGHLMSKDYRNVQLMGMMGGSTASHKELLRAKQAERKLRSKRHFKSEVLPTLNETPKITKHFNDKLKDI